MRKKLFILIFLIFVFLFFGINNSAFAVCSFSTDKIFYNRGDTATLTYSDVPLGSTLTITKPDGSEAGSFSLSGSGEISYDILADDLTGDYTISLTGTDCNVSKTVTVVEVGVGGVGHCEPCTAADGVQGECTDPLRCQDKKCQYPCEGNILCNPLKYCSLEDLIETIINFIFYVALAIAPLMIIIAAFYFITASGDPKRVKTAKDIITYTMIGLLVILLAKGLVSMIRGAL